MTDAAFVLIAVDVQNDFLPGGALGVANGDAVVKPLLQVARGALAVVATRDLHPADHVSFIARGGRWPAHCVMGTHGAQLHPAVDAVASAVLSKGMDSDAEAYSGFQATPLAAMLTAWGVGTVAVAGLATDYCVRATVLDGLRLGFQVNVITDAVRAVNASPGDGQRALDEMRDAGAVLREAAHPAAAG